MNPSKDKVPLVWRVILTPVAFLALSWFLVLGLMHGFYQWALALLEFWRGVEDEHQ